MISSKHSAIGKSLKSNIAVNLILQAAFVLFVGSAERST